MIDDLDTQLSLLELKCLRPVEHLLAGEFRSVFRGQGTEFEEVRPYQPGDDVRTIDWRVTARTNETYIKRYIEEREQFLYILVDVSASVLDVSGGKKRKLIAELAGLLTMAAAKNQDRVSLILFTDEIEILIPPGKSRSHTLRIMDALLNYIPTGKQTKIAPVLNSFGHFAHKYSIVFVISDFLADDYLDELCALSGKHDVNTISLLESNNILKEANELIHFRDAETGEQKYIDLKSAKQNPNTHQQQQRQLIEAGVSQMKIEPGANCAEALMRFFRTKQ